MCIIAAKPAGISMPDTDRITNMWTRNSDGAGFMYAKDGKVYIEKGFMKLNELLDRIKQLGKTVDLKSVPVVMHFRITTSGGTSPENCHPFPVTSNLGVLRKLKSTCALGVAHNGIIDITPRKGISDTMEYILSQLSLLYQAMPKFYESKPAMQLVENAIDSKMAMLTKAGRIYTIGNFEEDGGIMYSNTSYKGWSSYYTGGKYGTYDNGWSVYGSNYGYGWPSAWDDETQSPSTQVTQAITDDNGDTFLHPIDLFERPLMPIDLIDGAFVLDDRGDYLEPCDLYLDSLCRVWYYDVDTDACLYEDDLDAFDAKGQPLMWDCELTEPMLCYPVEY